MEAIQPRRRIPTLDPGAYLETPSSLVCDGDPGEEMAALAVENGEAERTAAHQERETEEAAQTQADAAQVQAMHDEACSLRAPGRVRRGHGGRRSLHRRGLSGGDGGRGRDERGERGRGDRRARGQARRRRRREAGRRPVEGGAA